MPLRSNPIYGNSINFGVAQNPRPGQPHPPRRTPPTPLGALSIHILRIGRVEINLVLITFRGHQIGRPMGAHATAAKRYFAKKKGRMRTSITHIETHIDMADVVYSPISKKRAARAAEPVQYAPFRDRNIRASSEMRSSPDVATYKLVRAL